MRGCDFRMNDYVQHIGKPDFKGVVVATIPRVPSGQATEPIWQIYVKISDTCEEWAWQHHLRLVDKTKAEADKVAAAIRAFS